MKYDDVKIGEYYKYRWGGKDYPEVLLYIVGRDPFTGRLVGACREWKEIQVDTLGDVAFELMEPI
jgi:hypothetical protein